MKKNWLLLGGVAVLLVAAVLMVNSARTNQSSGSKRATTQSPVGPASHDHSTHAPASKKVPAFEVAPTRASLGPTLPPERFTGPTREAYRAVREIPVTIAQLPCYCYCDQGFGHKSLYSCFEDDHASHCAVCVNEALLALRLEKEQKLTPAQIRETIIAQYSQ
ncbi:MAG TPA: CYCXC family (seleno)protein [Pyrinomonadaceae bacterium]|nr:CYCXC family (seleno)protein [Pyrinomonadaceae bacterium]